MTESEPTIDWSKTTFEGSRREQLLQAQTLTVRQRLEALDELTRLSNRLRTMPRQVPAAHLPPAVREPDAEYRVGPSHNEIVFEGCTPTPLANYLKALGVLRLLSARHPETRGFWRGDRFVLRTSLTREGIERFFLDDYAPTPIMAPWNGGSGFYFQERKSKEKDPATRKKRKLGIWDQETAATKTLKAISASTSSRFQAYGSALEVAKRCVGEAGLITAPDSGKQKDDFVLALRAALPDPCLLWMDASLAITAERTAFPPLLGSGGNDGNLDFTSNFMQRLIEVLGTSVDSPPHQSNAWLTTSLHGVPSPGMTNNNIGQFSPGQAGGPNGGPGFEAGSNINPWDFVLMIEGALSFAAAVVRRNADDPLGVMSFPFTVRAVGAGSGSLGEGDAANARGELWMPLWSQPATCGEVGALLAEGRVAFGRKPARDALDFARAVQHLGGYRGVRAFQRFGLLMRSGKAYLATPLSRVEVSGESQSRWLDDLDQQQWLERFRRYARGDNTANRFRILRRRLEDALFTLSGRDPEMAEAQALLMLLGETQRALSSSPKAWEALRPIPRLSEAWVVAADDGSPAFRIAMALAGLAGVGDEPLPFRAQLFPVERKRDRWMTAEAGEKVRFYTEGKGRLTDTLRALLERRLWLTQVLEMKDKKGRRDKPLSSPAGATLEDVAAFLRDARMDTRIAALLPGLSLCEIPRDTDTAVGEGTLPAAFGLLKLTLTPDRILRSLGWLGEQEHLPLATGMVAQLTAGNHGDRAVKTAWRRLRASGLTPAFAADALPALRGFEPTRVAGALLIPLRYGATGALARSVLTTPETKPQAA